MTRCLRPQCFGEIVIGGAGVRPYAHCSRCQASVSVAMLVEELGRLQRERLELAAKLKSLLERVEGVLETDFDRAAAEAREQEERRG